MVSNPGAGGLVRVVVDVFPQVIPEDPEKGNLRAREKVLPDAASGIVIMIVGDHLLIGLPMLLVDIALHLLLLLL